MASSHESHDEVPKAGVKKKFLNSWVEALSQYERPFKVVHNRSDTVRSMELSSKGGATSVREGPMPNLLNSTPIPTKTNGTKIPVESNTRQHRSKKNKSLPIAKNSSKTIIDLSNDNYTNNINKGKERYATSSIRAKTGITYYSISMSDNGDQRGSNFTPLKLEPFEMPSTYTKTNTSTIDGSSNKKLVITVSDNTKNALKKAERRARRKAKRELEKENRYQQQQKQQQQQQQQQEYAEESEDSSDFEPITIEDDDSTDNGMMKRAIERSKHDSGILKRRNDDNALPSDAAANINTIKKVVNNNNNNDNDDDDDEEDEFNGTLMPKSVRDLLASDSDDNEDDASNTELAAFAKRAFDASKQHHDYLDEPILFANSVDIMTTDSSRKSKGSSSKSKKRKHQEKNPKEIESPSKFNSNDAGGGVDIVESDNTHIKTKKIPKLTDDSVVKATEYLQCAFVDGLKGRCGNTGSGVYCRKHNKIVRDIEAAFDNVNEDVVNLNSDFTTMVTMENNDKSKRKRPFPKKSHGLTIENRDILLNCLDKIKQLNAQEISFNEKGKLILAQIKSLNRLFVSFDKQKRGVCEEKHRLIDTMSTLINSWTPMFVDVNDSSELIGFEAVVKNQRVINKILSRFKEPNIDHNNNS